MKSIVDVCKETPKERAKDSLTKYMDWFNHCSSVEDSIKKGESDFKNFLYTNDLRDLIGDNNKKCLEIGFGGGRLLRAASQFFDDVYGFDIHESFDVTETILKKFDVDNCHLLKPENDCEIDDNSINFVYSFITFQHFGSWDVAEFYLDVIKRVLTKDGCGIIFFLEGEQDILLREKTNNPYFWTSLHVSREFAQKEIEKRFSVIDIGKHVPSSAQFFIKFKNK